MQPIQINLSINVGMSKELQGFISQIVNRPQYIDLGAQTDSADTVKTAKPSKTKATKAQSTEVEKTEQEAPAEPKAETAQAKKYTSVDVREAMDKTRRRIEGENYKTNTDSEEYQKWHRPLTAFFKATAVMLGYDKPSTLPDSESRAKFIECCEAVLVQGDKLVTEEEVPF